MQPPSEIPHILIVDDQPDNARLLKKMLTPEGYHLTLLERGREVLEHVQKHPCDLLLLDVMMPDLDGLSITRQLKADATLRLIPILLVTARTDLSSVVAGLDAGADDYLGKPVERRELLARVRSALRTRALQLSLLRTQEALETQNQRLEQSLHALQTRTEEKAALQTEVGDLRRQLEKEGDVHRLQALVGRAPVMRELFEQLRLVATSDVTVLIRGETGTGKELAARALHAESPRAHGPFVALNCGAIPEGLLESELFGHEKGAFTGAVARKVGRFERAAGGTLFLDEIGDLPRPMQVKLLRVLQTREYERVGSTEPLKADVRIVTATHRDLEEMVQANEFRQDLYYRLNIFPVTLPPLRERLEDLPALSRHLLERLAKAHGLPPPVLQPESLALLMAYDWPGNVRELENTLERAVILSAGREIQPLHLNAIRPRSVPVLPETSGVGEPDISLPFKQWKAQLLEQHERRYIVAALRRYKGNMTVAGRETGVDAKTFSRKIAEYGIQRKEYLGRDGQGRDET